MIGDVSGCGSFVAVGASLELVVVWLIGLKRERIGEGAISDGEGGGVLARIGIALKEEGVLFKYVGFVVENGAEPASKRSP